MNETEIFTQVKQFINSSLNLEGMEVDTSLECVLQSNLSQCTGN